MSYCHTPGYRTKLEKDQTTFIIWGKYKVTTNYVPRISRIDGAKFSQGDQDFHLSNFTDDAIQNLKKSSTALGLDNATNKNVKYEDITSDINDKIGDCENHLKLTDSANAAYNDTGLKIVDDTGGTFVAWGEILKGVMTTVSGKFISNQGDLEENAFTIQNATIGNVSAIRLNKGIFYNIGTKQKDAIQFGKGIEECMKELLGMNVPPSVSDDDDDDDDDDQSVQSVNTYGLNPSDDDSIYSFSDNPLHDNPKIIVDQTQLSGILLKNFMKGMKHKFENDSSFHHTDNFNPDNQKNFLPEIEYKEKEFIERLVQLETEIINHNSENFNKAYQNSQFNDDSRPDKIDYYINEKGNSEFESPPKNVLVYDYYREKAVIIFYIKDDNTIYYRITSSNIYYRKPNENNNYSYRVTLKDNLFQSNSEDGFLFLPQKQAVVTDIFSENNDQFQSVGEMEDDINNFSIEPVFSYVIHNRKINYTVSYFRIDRSNLDKSAEDRTYLIDFDKYIEEKHSHQIRYINDQDIKLKIEGVGYRNDGYVGDIVDKNDDTKIIMPYYQGGSNIRKRKTKHKRKRKNATLKK